jgi:uncharacterized membrane protein
MENWLIALIVKPFVALIFLLALAGIRYLFVRYAPDSRIKRRLLLPVFHRKQSGKR